MLTAVHPGFTHTALVHDGPADLASRIGPDLDEGLARGHAALVCLDAPYGNALAAHLSRPDRVTFLPVGDRYLRPGVAMSVLHDFTTEALRQGAPTVWSIGSVPCAEPGGGARWVRYEAAVDEVLGHVPLRGVCTYERAATRHPRVRAAVDAHDHDLRAGVLADSDRRSSLRPPGEPSLSLCDPAPRVVRELITRRATVRPDLLDDAHLVASELLSNATRHGRGPVRVRAWLGARVVLEVSDGGDGLTDPFPDLRALRRGNEGGYGLWLVGQLADELSIRRAHGRTQVTATLGTAAEEGQARQAR